MSTFQSASFCESDPPFLNKGRSADLDITSEESVSFSVQDTSSLCDEYGELMLSPADTSGATDVGSTVFQNFLLCFDERELLQHQRALLNISSTSSCQSQQQQLQQSRPAPSLMRSRTDKSSDVAALPQLLWQPEQGLCCHDTVQTQLKVNEEIVLFQQERFGVSRFIDAEGNDLEAILSDDEPLLRPGSQLSTSAASESLHGGTVADPRYVPRPSSVTPGLREMSKFFRTLSAPEDSRARRDDWVHRHGEEALKPPVVTPIQGQREAMGADHLQSLSTFNLETAKQTSTASKSIVVPKTNSTALAQPLGRLLHRRSRSELKGSTIVPSLRLASVSGNITGALLQRSRTEDTRTSHRRSASEDGGKKGKTSLMGFLRRTRLPSFRNNKAQVSCNGSDKEDLNKALAPKLASAGTGGDLSNQVFDSSTDIVDILASLEDTLMEKVDKATQFSKSLVAPQKQPELLSTQASGETHSDTSSLFGGIESDADGKSCCSEESESADHFFESPYYPDQNDWLQEPRLTPDRSHSLRGSRQRYGKGPRNYTSGDSCDNTSMFSSRTELTRCSSVDTAKASNLSCDPSADRARLLEIQAYLWQQQRERERLLNTPPVEFYHDDNVISVREAACEIEVLPKRDVAASSTKTIPPTAAEF